MFAHRASLGLLTVVVLGVSALAYAQLGGPSGVRIPYQGRLEVDGQPANGPYDFDFEVFNAASGGTACAVFEESILVSEGAFSTVLGPVDADCVRGQDIFVQISVSTDRTSAAPEQVGARKQLFAAASAATSGAGDFHVEGNLDVLGAVDATHVGAATIFATASVSSPTINATSVTAPTVDATNLVADAITLDGVNLRNTLETQVVATNAAATNSQNFGTQTFTAGSSGRGVLLLSATAFRGNAGLLELQVLVDGVVSNTIVGFSNEGASHRVLPTLFHVVSGAPNATHTVQVRETGTTSVDFNDRLNIAFIDSF